MTSENTGLLVKPYQMATTSGVFRVFARDHDSASRLAFQRVQQTQSAITFPEFLKSHRVDIDKKPPRDFGKRILVDGEEAFLMEMIPPNALHFVFAGEETVMTSYQMDVDMKPPPPESRDPGDFPTL